MFGSTCGSSGCDNPARYLSGRCAFHEALANARDLDPAEFDRFQEVLTYTPPWTDEERRARRARSALHRVQWTARDLKRARQDAAREGATKGQVADAVARGKAEAPRDFADIVNKAVAKGAKRGKR